MTTRLPVEYPQTVLTLSASPCNHPDVEGSPAVPRLRYPTADEMRSRRKWSHGTAADRLARLYAIEPSGCWRWLGSFTTQGYGHFSIARVYYQAHRLFYILYRGPIPDGLEPDHLCRNRWCVNPNCIELVTHAVNMQRSVRARLTPAQTDAIRLAHANGAGVRALARQYGVNHATVSRLVNGLTWKAEPLEAVA